MSDAAFASAVARVLAHEGGIADDPADPGGLTKFGISSRSYPGLDVADLTCEDAAAIYRRDWWDRFGYGRLGDAIAIKLLDLAVSMGPRGAHELLQQSCNGLGARLTVDGVLGPATVSAADACERDALLAAMRGRAAERYRRIAEADPRLQRFLAGWLARASA